MHRLQVNRISQEGTSSFEALAVFVVEALASCLSVRLVDKGRALVWHGIFALIGL
jgi:hypothetical protein